MEIKRVLNIEDNSMKHNDIKRALAFNGIIDVDRARDAEEGLDMLFDKSKAHYDLLILDMQFPLNGMINNDAGMYIIKQIKERGCDIPVIVCSSFHLYIPDIVGCICYSAENDLNYDIKEKLDILRNSRA